MNKRQVLILWVIAIALAAAIAFVKFGRNQEIKSSTSRTTGQTLIESFPATEVASIEIKGATDATSLTKKDGKWIVAQRDNYPAKPSEVNGLLRTIGELKVTQGMQAGPSFAPRFGMDEASKDPKEHGIALTFKDASGKELTKVTVGKNIESTASASPMGGGSSGRFVRNHADESGFYSVSEMFSSLGEEPKRWLAEEFFKPEKIQSVSVTQPGKSDIFWKVVRADENADFALEGKAANEVVDPTVLNAYKSLFAFTRFEDIVPAAEVEKRAENDQKRTLKIVTFEGFVYTITFTPTKAGSVPPPVDPENPAPPAEETFLVTIDVSAEVPKERKKEDGEKEEDAKAKDAAFAERSKALNEKLAKEKALAGYTFQVSKSSFEAATKTRGDFFKKEEAADSAAPGPLPSAQEVVTPPIAVPPMRLAPPAPPEKPAGE